LGENKVQIYIKLPIVPVSGWSNIDFSKIVKLTGEALPGIKSTFVRFDRTFKPIKDQSNQSNQTRRLQTEDFEGLEYVFVEIEYNQTLEKKEMTLEIDPTASTLRVFSSIDKYQDSFKIVSENNQLLNYYDTASYRNANTLTKLSEIIGFVCFGLILFGLFVGNMMIPLETASIVQLSYFSLLWIGELNPFYLALTGLKYASGFNIALKYSNPSQDPSNLKQFIGVGLYSSMLDNCNVSLVLVLLCLLVGGALKLIVKFLIKREDLIEKIGSIGSNLIGSSVMYLLNCFALLIAVSICVNFKTGSSAPINYVIVSVCALLCIGYLGFFLKFFTSEYFTKLLEKVHNSKFWYVSISFVLKLLIGALIVVMGDQSFCGIIIFVLMLLWTVGVLANLKPYRFPNMIRIGGNLFLTLCIQMIYIYQKYSYNDSKETDLHLLLPFSIIGILILILLINLVFYIYSIKQIRCC
jgi:hypothetical protein